MRAWRSVFTCVLVAGLLGCNHTHVTAQTNTGTITYHPQSAPMPGDDLLVRVPAPVGDAFRVAHPKATVRHVKQRLAIDQTMHYFIAYTEDNTGRVETEYKADGSMVK